MKEVTVDFHEKGLEALRNSHFSLARVCFEQAAVEGARPETSSCLAFCRAKTGGGYGEAIALAEAALAADPENPLHYLNLGHIHLEAGNRRAALATFRSGIPHDRSGDIIIALERLGNRQPLAFPSLPRRHPLNRICGFLRRRLGFV